MLNYLENNINSHQKVYEKFQKEKLSVVTTLKDR
jgi:hypothetical protein